MITQQGLVGRASAALVVSQRHGGLGCCSAFGETIAAAVPSWLD